MRNLSSGRAPMAPGIPGWAILVGFSLLMAACGGGQTDTEETASDNTVRSSETFPATDDQGSTDTGGSTDDEGASVTSTTEAAAVPSTTEAPVFRPVGLAVAERGRASANPENAGSAVTSFGFDLFSAARRSASGVDGAENLTVSPASVATALAMLEPGTVDAAQGELRSLLAITNSDRFHASMNSLQQDLETREPDDFGEGDPGEVTIRIANAAYLQEGYPFEEDYLDVIGTNYGSVLYEVDFGLDPDAVARGINDFVADATEQQITDLIADGVIDPATVLALVNALYFKGSWLEPFEPEETTTERFTRLDETTVNVEMMRGFSSSSAEGDGWVGATKAYAGGLEAQFILPDEGRFDEVAADLWSVFDRYEANRTAQADLAVPKFDTRSSVELDEALKALGLTAPYEQGGLLGIAADPKLVVDRVIHETFVAMDEQGTEAAAATVVLTLPTSGPPSPPVAVVLDRPFIYRIIDRQTGATLFIGQMVDPTRG